MIPPQLWDKKFTFIKIGKGVWEKKPIESGWTIDKNYKYDNKSFLEWVDKENRYGIICGVNSGGLLVIDFDNKFFQENLEKILPKTFTVETANKKLHHMYYFVDKPFRKIPLKDKDKNTLADLQCNGSLVVGPNSVLDNGNFYRIVNDMEIQRIKFTDLQKIFTSLEEPKEKKVANNGEGFTGDVEEILNKIDIVDVLKKIGVNCFTNGKYKCPFHSISKGNKHNAYVNKRKQLYHCFHCGSSGNIFNLIMEYRGCNFKEALKELQTFI